MKRELKAESAFTAASKAFFSHKANPYEKGTERMIFERLPERYEVTHKANPYEKGTERPTPSCRPAAGANSQS